MTRKTKKKKGNVQFGQDRLSQPLGDFRSPAAEDEQEESAGEAEAEGDEERAPEDLDVSEEED